jgi:hypothetical protein
MNKPKHLVNIDDAIINVLSPKIKSIGDIKSFAVSKELLDSGCLRKIAFDVYKVENDPYDGLWLLEDVGGRQHLVRASNPEFEMTTQSEWSAVTDYDKENITLNYKNAPIARFSSSEYNYTKEEASTFKSALLDMIKNDELFVKDVLASQPHSKLEAITSTYPELKKFI